jgi:hypothetical protein
VIEFSVVRKIGYPGGILFREALHTTVDNRKERRPFKRGPTPAIVSHFLSSESLPREDPSALKKKRACLSKPLLRALVRMSPLALRKTKIAQGRNRYVEK